MIPHSETPGILDVGMWILFATPATPRYRFPMARRHRRQSLPLGKFLSAGLVLLFLAFGGYLLQQRTGDPFRAMQPLEASVYLDNANSLRGNRYRMTGSIENALAWSADQGRLFSVRLEQRDDPMIGVIVPAELGHVNIQKGQRFDFHVEVGERGLLYVREMRKS